MGFSDGCSAGFGVISNSSTEEFVGNGATLAFTLSAGKVSDVTAVHSWVGSGTNDWAAKTETTHWTHDAAENITVTYEAGNAPIAAQKELRTVTFPALLSAVAGDFFYMDDAAGLRWGVSLDVAGTDPAPTSAIWTAIPAGRKVHVDISGTSTAATVAAAVEAAFDALTGVTTKIVTDDAAANGTMTFQIYTTGDYSGTVGVSTTDGEGDSSISQARTVHGKTNTCRVTFTQTASQLKDGLASGM